MNKKQRKSQQKLIALSLLGASVLALSNAAAAESILDSLGWSTKSSGTEMDSNSQAQVIGNKAPALVSGSGAKASVLANIGVNSDMQGTAQANGIGMAAMQLRNSQLAVLDNQVSGFVNAFGGAATANMLLAASGEGRKPLSSTQLLLQGNRASNIDAFGGKVDVLLGTASLQMPGRASANSMLVDASEFHNVQAALVDNEARNLVSIGGSALANALTAARSTLRDTQFLSSSNEARDIRAGGGTAGLGRGTIAEAKLTGISAANSAAIASSELRNAQLSITGNRAEQLTSTGGSALANSISITDHQLGGAGYEANVSDNEARKVQAWGGEGSLLSGAIAEVRMSAAALANAVSVQRGELTQRPVHAVSGNIAGEVVATGGGAGANSIWLDDAKVQGGQIQVTGNTANQIRTVGGSGSVGGGVVASVERNGRALGNTVALDRQAVLDQAKVTLDSNTSSNVTGVGGLAAANSLAVTDGKVSRTAVTLANNRANDVQSTGGGGNVGAGLLYSSSQDSVALANSVSVGGSQLEAKNLAVMGNTASGLNARGGTLMANSVALESGGAKAAKLVGDGTIADNTARNMSTTAKSSSGGGGLVSSDSNARAAANSLVLHEDVEVDASSPWSIASNIANGVHAGGGTALVNAFAAYRGARIQSSPVSISGNTGENISTGGGANQALGVGSKTNGILVANSVYLEGPDAVSLRSTPVQIAANTARELSASGGRLNANAVAINGSGKVQGSTLNVIGNTASHLRSEGKETTLIGHAIDKGVGQTNANAIQVLASLQGATLQLIGNTAEQVSASKGLAAANSIAQDQGAGMNSLNALVMANRASQVSADGGHTALANSIAAEESSSIEKSAVQVIANQGGAQAAGGDATANSVRAHDGGRIGGASVAIMANRGSAQRGGTINSVVAKGSVKGGQITVMGNSGTANQGVANSVMVDGRIAASSITILGNHGSTDGGGTVNSVTGNGSIKSSQILIAGNTGSAKGGGIVNSVSNRGSITGANIALIGNRGSTVGGGLVNSVENKGQLSGQVIIAGNRGNATMGGKVNSLVNEGVMTGQVVIAGNQGSAAMGGVSNSVINKGVISGTVTIVGGKSVAAAGITSGSVRNYGGVIVGAAGVAGNAAFAANPGYTVATPSVGVVNNTVTVLPAVNVVSN